MKIYLAGRCDTDWRREIVDIDLCGYGGGFYPTDPPDVYPYFERCIFGEHDYTGAFPVDIGSGRSTPYYHGICYKSFNHCTSFSEGQSIQRKCFNAIDASDILFAWLDREGLYGTSAEIAYAHARKKNVWIAWPGGDMATLEEYWFIAHLASVDFEIIRQPWIDSDFIPMTPRSALEGFLKLHTLKTMPYADYLKTNHWQSVRQNALVRCGYKCMLCSSKDSLHVHHNTYERRGYEADSDLTVLCRSCHYKFHQRGAA